MFLHSTQRHSGKASARALVRLLAAEFPSGTKDSATSKNSALGGASLPDGGRLWSRALLCLPVIHLGFPDMPQWEFPRSCSTCTHLQVNFLQASRTGTAYVQLAGYVKGSNLTHKGAYRCTLRSTLALSLIQLHLDLLLAASFHSLGACCHPGASDKQAYRNSPDGYEMVGLHIFLYDRVGKVRPSLPMSTPDSHNCAFHTLQGPSLSSRNPFRRSLAGRAKHHSEANLLLMSKET